MPISRPDSLDGAQAYAASLRLQSALDALERVLLMAGDPVSEHTDPLIEPRAQNRASSGLGWTEDKSERHDILSICSTPQRKIEQMALQLGAVYHKLQAIDLT